MRIYDYYRAISRLFKIRPRRLHVSLYAPRDNFDTPTRQANTSAEMTGRMPFYFALGAHLLMAAAEFNYGACNSGIIEIYFAAHYCAILRC
jgi:hypothetical protein